jgi:hypothetical protein
MSPRLLACLVPTIILVASAGASDKPEGYTFTVDGTEIKPAITSLNATPDKPQTGDVVWIDCATRARLGKDISLPHHAP